MNFKDIVSKRFLRKQKRIKKINTENINVNELYCGSFFFGMIFFVIFYSFSIAENLSFLGG